MTVRMTLGVNEKYSNAAIAMATYIKYHYGVS